MKYFKGVYGMVPEEDLLTTGLTVARQNDPTDRLFPDEFTRNLVAKWRIIASQYQIPQMAQFHAFDTVAQKSVRAPIDERSVEKGLIKVKRSVTELLYTLMNSGVTQEEELYRYVMEDTTDLADEVITRTKVAKNELLSTGQVTMYENNLNDVVDYGVPESHKGISLDFGAGAEKDIVSQLQDISEMASDEGISLNGIYASKSAYGKLRTNESVQKAINGVYMSGVMVTNASLSAWLEAEFDITNVITNDLSYSLPWDEGADGRPVTHTRRYFPTDTITFFGTGNGSNLGVGLWGLPPEEQIARFGGVEESTLNPYVYVHQYKEDDPAVIWTKASALFMPVLYNPSSLYIAKVVETTAE